MEIAHNICTVMAHVFCTETVNAMKQTKLNENVTKFLTTKTEEGLSALGPARKGSVQSTAAVSPLHPVLVRTGVT